MTEVEVKIDRDEVSRLVVQLTKNLFPKEEEIPLARVLAILEALAVITGSIVRAYAFAPMEDERGRRAVVIDKNALIEHLLDLARETIWNQSEEEQH